MTDLVFSQVDVFSSRPFLGNPVAVVHGADALSEAQMAAFARWTNLSETTFLLSPTDAAADYRLRIFTPGGELPFAGHPTLGSCHAWIEAGGRPRGRDVIQQCALGLIRVRREPGSEDGTLAFAAPALLRSGPVDASLRARIAAGLGVAQAAMLEARWIDNGPGWIGVRLGSRAEVLALRPDLRLLNDLDLGVVGPWDRRRDGDEAHFEVRAFAPGSGVDEDPVTGSLNAGIAQWLIGDGLAPPAYVASQGTAIGRRGRISVRQDGDDIWIGGATVTRIRGALAAD